MYISSCVCVCAYFCVRVCQCVLVFALVVQVRFLVNCVFSSLHLVLYVHVVVFLSARIRVLEACTCHFFSSVCLVLCARTCTRRYVVVCVHEFVCLF